MVKKIETLKTTDEKSEVISTTKKELSDLNLSIWPDKRKDREKFEKLSKDSDLQKWLEKIYDKSCKMAFSEEWKVFEKMNISKKLNDILKSHPSLWLKISWDLWLPLWEAKFSKLTTQQKVNFTTLYKAIDKKNLSTEDIISRINRFNKENFNKINRQFEKENAKNFLRLETTLKEFWLNSKEISKVSEYMLLVKKHPEFIWDMQPEKAGWARGYVIVAVLAFALWAIWMHYIENMWKEKTETTTVLNGTTTIENPEKVLRLLTQKAQFKNGWTTRLRPEYDNAITDVLEEIPLIRHVVRLSREQIEALQTKEIEMEFSWELAMQFDLDKWCSIDINITNWKWVAYVQLPKPEVIVTNWKAKIVNVDRELVHVKAYDQAEEDLRKELEQKAIDDALKDPNFYEKWRKDVKDQLKDLFSVLQPKWVNIVDVQVSFFDPAQGPQHLEFPHFQVR